MNILKRMKHKFILFWVIFISMLANKSFACENFLPKSQLELIASGVDLGDKVKFCKDLPKEECICYENFDLRAIKIEKEKIKVDVFDKKLEEVCKSEKECWAKLEEWNAVNYCDNLKETGEIKGRKGEEEKYVVIYNRETSSIYCSKKIGEEIKETDKYVLSEDADKKAEIILAEAAAEQAAQQEAAEVEAAKIRIKDFDKTKIKSVEDVTSFLEDISKVIK